jgi:hypothetical protein
VEPLPSGDKELRCSQLACKQVKLMVCGSGWLADGAQSAEGPAEHFLVDSGAAAAVEGGVGGQAGPVAEVAVGGVLVCVGDVVGVGFGPEWVVERDDVQDFFRGEAGEVLPDEDAGGQHGFFSEGGVASFSADENDGELGVGVVPEVAAILQLVAGKPLCFVKNKCVRVGGKRAFQEVVEFAGVARGLAGELEGGEQCAGGDEASVGQCDVLVGGCGWQVAGHGLVVRTRS